MSTWKRYSKHFDPTPAAITGSISNLSICVTLPFPTNPALKDLQPYQPGRPIEEVARELGMSAAGIIKLASNENPLGPSPAALQAMRRVLDSIHLYPDGTAYYLKQKLAAKLDLDDGNFIFGNGSSEILEF